MGDDLLKAKCNAVAIVQIACDLCAGVSTPITDPDEQARIEATLIPLEHTTVVVKVGLGIVDASTIGRVIEYIWSLRYASKAWQQRRQYLELINCSVVDYVIRGEDTGDLMSLADTASFAYKPISAIDKTLQAIITSNGYSRERNPRHPKQCAPLDANQVSGTP